MRYSDVADQIDRLREQLRACEILASQHRKERDKARAEVARLRASNREYMQQANQARDAAADELHNQTQDLIEQRDEARAAARWLALPGRLDDTEEKEAKERWPWLEDSDDEV